MLLCYGMNVSTKWADIPEARPPGDPSREHLLRLNCDYTSNLQTRVLNHNITLNHTSNLLEHVFTTIKPYIECINTCNLSHLV